MLENDNNQPWYPGIENLNKHFKWRDIPLKATITIKYEVNMGALNLLKIGAALKENDMKKAYNTIIRRRNKDIKNINIVAENGLEWTEEMS
jgi:hypothetical protein